MANGALLRPHVRPTFRPLVRQGALMAGLFLLGGLPAVAQEEAAPAAEPAVEVEDVVVATVNGEPVRYSDIAMAEADLATELSGVPDEVRFEYLSSLMVDRKVLAGAAREAGLEDDPEVARTMAFYLEKTLGDVYLARQLADAVSDEEARAFYDKQVAQVEVKEEVRARHILLESEEDALAVIERLKAGEDFVAVAKEASTGPSGAGGGDLGYFTADRMVPEFSTAAFALEAGEISAPVKSDFGWHVIKLEDRRMQQVVPFETVKADIKAQLRDEKAAPFIEGKRNEAKIEYTESQASRPQIVPQQ